MEKRQKIVIFSLGITILILIILRIYVINEMSIYNTELASLQENIKTVKEANMLLEQQVLIYSAYTSVYPEAVKRGFVPARLLFY